MDVVGIGTPVADLLSHIEKLPKENESVRMIDYSWQFGGKVPTAMAALARLGAKAGMVGVVGGDVNGMRCIEDFKYNGVDTSRIIIDREGETPFCIVISEEAANGRNIVYHSGKRKELLIEDLDKEYITSARFLHLSEINRAARQAALWAKEKGMTVVFDADGYNPDIEDMLPLIDVFIGSEFYYRGRFSDGDYEKNCSIIQGKGPGIVSFTFGEKGCVVMDNREFLHQDIFKVDVVDTTGAGDVFHGAFIYGLLKGWSTRETTRFASAVSAIKCTRIGGRAGIPDIRTAIEFIENGRINYGEIDERVLHYRGIY